MLGHIMIKYFNNKKKVFQKINQGNADIFLPFRETPSGFDLLEQQRPVLLRLEDEQRQFLLHDDDDDDDD